MSELETCWQNARILQGKYQDTAAALDRAHQVLERVAARHKNNGFGGCTTCYGWQNIPLRWPCADYLDATGATP